MISEERPPSQPGLWLKPERAAWPFWPRPLVLPRPLPMPRPTRRRTFLLPGAGFRSFSFILFSLFDLKQEGDLVHHAANVMGVLDDAGVAGLAQAQGANRGALV